MKTSEVIQLGRESSRQETWDGRIGCQFIHKADLRYEGVIEGVSMYSFVVVRRGRFTIRYNGTLMELRENDIHTYAPGMPTEAVDVTDDYEGYFMLIDEELVHGTPLMHHLIRAVYQPIAEFSRPVFSMTDGQASMVWADLSLLRQHILAARQTGAAPFLLESLLALCTTFIIDLTHILETNVEHAQVNNRYEQIFSQFLPLVHDHYRQHHDLRFYADRLCISVPYLSRIVRVMSGRTVMSFIDHALAQDAARRLRATDQSVTQMAFDLGFSDQAAFTKFFIRMRGISPREFRKSSRQ